MTWSPPALSQPGLGLQMTSIPISFIAGPVKDLSVHLALSISEALVPP